MTNDEAVRKYGSLVLMLAKARTRQPSDAEDVFQDVFCQYIAKKPKFKDDNHAKAWFIKVTINMAKNMYSRFEYTKRSDIEDSDLENIISDEDFLRKADEREDLERILSRLHEDYRTVLVMHFYFGYSIEEMAKLLGKTKPSINGLMMRAKKQCSELIDKEKAENDKNNDKAEEGDNND